MKHQMVPREVTPQKDIYTFSKKELIEILLGYVELLGHSPVGELSLYGLDERIINYRQPQLVLTIKREPKP